MSKKKQKELTPDEWEEQEALHDAEITLAFVQISGDLFTANDLVYEDEYPYKS